MGGGQHCHLAEVFAVAVWSHAVMSNHLHVVVEVIPQVAAAWSADEVAARWCRAYPRQNQDANARAEGGFGTRNQGFHAADIAPIAAADAFDLTGPVRGVKARGGAGWVVQLRRCDRAYPLESVAPSNRSSRCTADCSSAAVGGRKCRRLAAAAGPQFLAAHSEALRRSATLVCSESSRLSAIPARTGLRSTWAMAAASVRSSASAWHLN